MAKPQLIEPQFRTVKSIRGNQRIVGLMIEPFSPESEVIKVNNNLSHFDAENLINPNGEAGWNSIVAGGTLIRVRLFRISGGVITYSPYTNELQTS